MFSHSLVRWAAPPPLFSPASALHTEPPSLVLEFALWVFSDQI
jgi:hypothetical protein